MKEIKITKGQVCIVDDDKFDLVSKTGWCAQWDGYHFYARGRIGGKLQLMHRVIMGAKSGQIVDHINGNSLDNRTENLRFVTHRQNMVNRVNKKKRSSKYKGVAWQPNCSKWQANITVDGKLKYLGVFDDEVKAASVYDSAAAEHFGEYANFNFPVSLLAVALKERSVS